jgi:O-acetyl-ADP-ribose deacetylase (regulator of RNase III)
MKGTMLPSLHPNNYFFAFAKSSFRHLEDMQVFTPGSEYVALPAIGCGIGGLNWRDVRKVLESKFAQSEKIAYAYPPLRRDSTP